MSTEVGKYTSRAPTRIDLAGGTIDLWPLYLFLKNPQTINLGINLYAEAQLQTQPQGSSSAPRGDQFTLESLDQKIVEHLTAEQLLSDSTDLRIPPQLILHYRFLKHFYLKKINTHSSTPPIAHHTHLSTRAQSPAGAGLGGSSTLSVALVGALASWSEPHSNTTRVSPETHGLSWIDLIKDIETTVIAVPAGLQDYFGAMFGGLQSIHWCAGGHQHSHFDLTTTQDLADRLILFYSGQSRNSGINNWALFKNLIDRVSPTPQLFQKICYATSEVETSLQKKDWTRLGKAIDQEWASRKQLATGITTAEMDRAFETAKAIAPVSGKVCGAGGGGCFFVYLPEGKTGSGERAYQKVIDAFEQQGIRHLPFQAAPEGLKIRIERA